MNLRRGLAALACGLVAVIGVAGSPKDASADEFVWVAKFACPEPFKLADREEGAFNTDNAGGGFVRAFYFETVINIYNPNDTNAMLEKTVVLALRQSQLSSFTAGIGGAQLRSNTIVHALAARDALAVDCTGIARHLVDNLGKGFVAGRAVNDRIDGVVEIRSNDLLKVETLYGTAKPASFTQPGGGSTIQVIENQAVVVDTDDDDDSSGDDDDSSGDDDDSSGDDDDSSGDDDDSVSDDDDSSDDDDTQA